MNEIVIFIHAACVDGVEKKLQQYTLLIESSGLIEKISNVFISVVGSGTLSWKPSHEKIIVIPVSNNLGDYELPTQALLWRYAKVNPSSKILYLHTKGVGKERNECIEDWIDYMLHFCVEKHEDALLQLERNDTVGVDLLEKPTLHYSGNFWWANASYLRTLPEPNLFADLTLYPNPLNSMRHNQEFWICSKKQAHACLWQSEINCFERHLHRYPRKMYDLKDIGKSKQMSTSLCIFFLTGAAREQFLPTIVENLSNSKYKKDIHFLVLTDIIDVEQKYIYILQNTGINYTIESFDQRDNYMSKVRFALDFVEKNNIPYMMKHDNDILCSPYMYDFLYENKAILQDEKNLLLTPTLTSGIPTVEQFLNDFCTEDEKKEMNSLFLKYIFGNTWGVNYNSLNKHTLFSSEWNALEYFKGVKEIQHPYRGIHPVRMNDKAIYRLNEIVLKHKQEIMGEREVSLLYDNFSPYFCNSIYVIRSDIYKKIINSPQLFIDPFDELPLNLYRDMHRLNIVYTKNGCAIHPIYNSVSGNDAYEKEFMAQYLLDDNLVPFEDSLRKFEAVDTSKGTDKNTSHSYGPVYTSIFSAFQKKPIDLLEIGFACGASLLAYADYFPEANIYGIDINDERIEAVKHHSRIYTKIEDAIQNKNSFQKQFDIIVEDASHLVEHQLQHFIDFAPSVKPDGIYIIEDIHQDNYTKLREGIEPFLSKYGFTLEVKDLRSIKKRFDDILFILKRNNYRSTSAWQTIHTFIRGMNALEVGGPTELFSNPSQSLYCYNILASLDNVNNPKFHFPNNENESGKTIFQTNYNLETSHITSEVIPKKYDLILSSHTVEHLANPIQFLMQVKGLLRKEGYILTILPNKPCFWDKNRETTPTEHIIQDYINKVDDTDMTHLNENIFVDCPIKLQKGQEYWSDLCRNNYNTRVMHHHCFEVANTQAIHEYAGFQTIFCEVFNNEPLQLIYFGKKI